MSHNKRKSNVIEPEVEKVELTTEKRSKIDLTTNDFLRLNDVDFIETNYQNAFQTIADKLINSYELVINEQHFFRLSEIEFYFYHQIRHPDTFAHRHPEQQYHSNWYFHRQGTSPTAGYKAGTYKGLDLTFNSLNDLSYGGILIRSIENKQTGQIHEGSCLVVDAILNLCNSKTINELVENKLNKNLNIFNKNSFIYLRSISTITNYKLIESPRVGLTLKNPTIERERFLFRSYRFTPKDYYPTKMKFMILLSLAVEKYFLNKKEKFIDYAKDLSIETNIRLSTVMSNLNDLQNGYDINTLNKTSPLVDYYKKNFTTSDLAKAYGIWLRNYRSN
ncbi:unnamed protein product [Rotaria sp. Silwood2]|nr:unnamed protein product [Rotaria sp. Silwood2]CAF3306197.1 unnamed protein product [Rotaria sp. Silwood2]CAF3977966.1 unnamed protein product [Rotaria sp. Silwood2]CAF4218501.1 unnamed protein product [Rotaria sp. Silwood2]